MKLEYAPLAQSDLRAIFLYVKDRNPRAALSVVDEIRSRCESLLLFPLKGARTGIAGIRRLEIGRYPYFIFYRVEGDKISIVHIRHTRRQTWQGDE
ncbi:MAG: type II toxin-antitoxin system RelE/ParE family toxin [Rhizobiales bacterium]|nr:type II toxin-antitoxin system RelE/ParE family toxin [Hyphomicrobiales bacterium]